jgi:hypothetical protein
VPFPDTLTTVIITGTFLDYEGDPRRGTVQFTLATPIYSTGDNVIIPPFTTDLISLDQNGSFAVELPATTDPQWLPNTATYVVQAYFSDFRKLWWQFPAPYDTAGLTIDLADVGPPNVGTPSATIRQGVIPSSFDGGFRSTYAADTLYRPGDTVIYSGAVYGALKASAGVTPGTSATVWKVYPGGGGGGGAVDSVFGRTGDVVAVSGDYAIADITGLTAALSGKQAAGDYATNTALAAKASTTYVDSQDAALLVTAEAYTDTAVSGRVPTTRQVIAGTGLTGGGTLAADRTLAVSYGTSSTTAAAGNDARLSDTRTPTDGSVTTAKIVDANVTLAKLAAIAAATLLGSSAGGTPTALTASQVKTLLAIAQSDVSGLTAALALKAALASPSFTGGVTVAGPIYRNVVTLTDAGTVTPNASLADNFLWVLTGVANPATLAPPSNPGVDGRMVIVELHENGTGGFTVGLDAGIRDPNGYFVDMDTAANKSAFLGLRWSATLNAWCVMSFTKGY